MISPHTIQLATNVSIWTMSATFILSLAFCVVYGFSRWWEHESGRNMMAFEFIITVVTGSSLLPLLIDDTVWFLWTRVGVFIFVPIILAWRLWMLIRVQYFTLDDDTQLGRRYDDSYEHDTAEPGGGADDGVRDSRRCYGSGC